MIIAVAWVVGEMAEGSGEVLQFFAKKLIDLVAISFVKHLYGMDAKSGSIAI